MSNEPCRRRLTVRSNTRATRSALRTLQAAERELLEVPAAVYFTSAPSADLFKAVRRGKVFALEIWIDLSHQLVEAGL